MAVILAAIVAAVVLAGGGGLFFYLNQTPTYEAYSVPSVRIGDPGENLVGANWSGLPRPGEERPGQHRAQADAARPPER